MDTSLLSSYSGGSLPVASENCYLLSLECLAGVTTLYKLVFLKTERVLLKTFGLNGNFWTEGKC